MDEVNSNGGFGLGDVESRPELRKAVQDLFLGSPLVLLEPCRC